MIEILTNKIFIIIIVILFLACIYCFFIRKSKPLKKYQSKKSYKSYKSSSFKNKDYDIKHNYNDDNDNNHDNNYGDDNDDNDLYLKDRRPVIKFFKIGGDENLDFKLEVYSDQTYELFDKNELKRTGKFDSVRFEKILFILENVKKLKSNYCTLKGFNKIYHRIETDKKNINLGSFEIKCIPNDIYHSIKILEKMVY